MRIEITTTFHTGMVAIEADEVPDGSDTHFYARVLFDRNVGAASVEIVDMDAHTAYRAIREHGRALTLDRTIEHQIGLANLIEFVRPGAPSRVCQLIRGKWYGPVGQAYTADDMVTQIRAHESEVKLTRVVTETIGVHNVI